MPELVVVVLFLDAEDVLGHVDLVLRRVDVAVDVYGRVVLVSFRKPARVVHDVSGVAPRDVDAVVEAFRIVAAGEERRGLRNLYESRRAGRAIERRAVRATERRKVMPRPRRGGGTAPRRRRQGVRGGQNQSHDLVHGLEVAARALCPSSARGWRASKAETMVNGT